MFASTLYQLDSKSYGIWGGACSTPSAPHFLKLPESCQLAIFWYKITVDLPLLILNRLSGGQFLYFLNSIIIIIIIIIISLITFGEVHHSLIQYVLRYHYIPDEINCIGKILYSDFRLSIITNDFHTKYIAVEKGILQGDSFSHLIFNLIINMFIHYVKEEKFPYDAVAVTSLEGENQILLNLFSKWFRCSEITIKVSKCHSFGICKKHTTSTQYETKLYLYNALIPPVKLDDCFNCLGHHVDFKMSDDKHKSELIETITDQIEFIDKLRLHPNNKLKLYQQWALSKVSWHLTVTKISNTCMKNNIDNIVSRNIRLWLEIPVNGTFKLRHPLYHLQDTPSVK